MIILLATIANLLAAFFFHLLWWRVALPAHQLRMLLLIFGLFFGCGTLAVLWRPQLFSLGEAGPLVGWLYFAVFYWAAAFCYMITYSAMEGDSPTLSLTRHLHRKGSEGILHDEMEEFFRQRPFVGARIKALVTDEIFIEETGGYRLAPGKYLFFRLILGYRRVVFGKIKDGG